MRTSLAFLAIFIASILLQRRFLQLDGTMATDTDIDRSVDDATAYFWMNDTTIGIPQNEMGKFYISFGICCSKEAQQTDGKSTGEIYKRHNHSNKRYDIALMLAVSLWKRHYQNNTRVSIFVAAGYIKDNEESEQNLSNLQSWLKRVENLFGQRMSITVWPYDVSSFPDQHLSCVRAGQIGRFYAHESGLVRMNDFIVTTDTDIFPINHRAMIPLLDGIRNPCGDFHRVFIASYPRTINSRTIQLGLGIGMAAHDWRRSLNLAGSPLLKDALYEANALAANDTWWFDQELSTRAIKHSLLCDHKYNATSTKSTLKEEGLYTCYKGDGSVLIQCLDKYDKTKRCSYAHFRPSASEQVMQSAYDEIIVDLYPTDQPVKTAELILPILP